MKKTSRQWKWKREAGVVLSLVDFILSFFSLFQSSAFSFFFILLLVTFLFYFCTSMLFQKWLIIYCQKKYIVELVFLCNLHFKMDEYLTINSVIIVFQAATHSMRVILKLKLDKK